MAIVKHNKLIETSYKLSSREQFFVLYLISKISQQDKDMKDHRMHYSEIERIINFDGKRRIANKSEVFALMDKLNSEPIIYEKGSIIGKSVWLQHLEHDTESDVFTFSLSRKLREYLMQLKEHFTRYNISNIVYLNANAVRLYEVLKRYQFKGECELTVDKVKFYLGIEDRYTKFYEFKRWVLIPSQREIEKYTDIRFEFVPAKKDRKKILSLKFYIYENDPKHSSEQIKLLSKLDPSMSRQKLESQVIKPTDDPLKQQLSVSQYKAYQYLVNKKVNRIFVLEQILGHDKLNYLPLVGYEDIYIKILWKFFFDKTNSEKPAGAFVSWWKNGRLTDDNLHARMMEAVTRSKKAMGEKERNERESIKRLLMAQYEAENADPVVVEANKSTPMPRFGSSFNIDKFKEEHSKMYKSILAEVKDSYESTFRAVGQSFDADKHRKAIEDRVMQECKEWLSRN